MKIMGVPGENGVNSRESRQRVKSVFHAMARISFSMAGMD